jgi:fibronectin type 3 domain-containing protein
LALICPALICLALAASCGRKTDPLTPPSPRPEAVKDVKAVARDDAAFLSWPVPTKNVEGKDMNLAEILGFRVFRAEVERGKKKPRYKLVGDIDLAKPAPAEVRNGRVFWSDTNLRYGQVYSYRIRALSVRGGVSQPSEEVRVAPLLSLAAPRMLNAVGGDSYNLLSWDTVTTRADGSRYEGFVGYNVYRGTEKGRYDETPLNKEPLRTNTYKDTAVANNKTYYYMVRAVDSPIPPWKESLDSPETPATSRDLTPPDKPKGLTVVPGVGRIFLTWNENKERDLAGYHVYRSTKSGRDYQRLTDKPINRTTFSDETVKPGVLYYYAVTAIDESGNESPMSKEQKAYAEKLR